MNARFLITLLQALPPDSEIRISFYDDQWEKQRVLPVNSVKFSQSWGIKEKDGSITPKEPNRVILS
jgi:hypothetical protein